MEEAEFVYALLMKLLGQNDWVEIVEVIKSKEEVEKCMK